MPYNIIIGRNESDRKKFGEKGVIFIGRHFVKMGPTTSLSNKIFLDVARAHVILVAGKRGSGKCLLGDTLIQLDDGNQVPIQDLANNQNNIMGLNDKLKIEALQKNDFFEREVDKILYIKLRSGKEIKLTPEHPLLTIKGWYPAKELTLGSRIATARKIDTFGNNDMEDYKIKLLAYLIAEGHTMKSWVLFSNSDDYLIRDFEESVKNFDNNLKVDIHSKKGCFRVSQKVKKYIIKEFKRNSKGQFTDNNIIYEKSSINKWLKSLDCYGYYAKEKQIPKEIFRLNKESLALFLNRLFSCDGSIYKNESRNGWEIDYSSSSKKLIYQVHNLLLRFGILSRIRKKKVKCNNKIFGTYELILNPKNTIRFIKEIGFFGKKAKKQERCLEEVVSIIRNPNVDTIPKEIWDVYRPSNWAEIGRGVGYAHPKAMRERIRYAPSRETLLQIAKVDENEQLKLLAQSDIFWDEIIEMKVLEGKFKVYDISVPKFHNFIANDIIVHNSYTLGVMAESMANLPEEIANNLAVVIFDTMGIFWSMKYPNERQEKLLNKWELQPKELDIDVYVPKGSYKEYVEKDLPVDYSFSIKTSELTSDDWCNVFEVKITEPIGILIDRVIENLIDRKEDYDIKEIVAEVKKQKTFSSTVRAATENRFLAADKWGLFSKKGTEIKDIVKPGRISVLDLSAYRRAVGAWSIKGLVIAMISRKLLAERIIARKGEELEAIREGTKFFGEKEIEEMPLVWLMIDEGHEFLPRVGKNPATDALIQLLREGRQPGISMVVATQQPGEIARDVITQSDIVLSHRVTARMDIDALNAIMQTYLLADINSYMNNLPRLKGSAIILDDNSERIYPMRVRPKMSWHGGEAPTAIKIRKRAELGLL